MNKKIIFIATIIAMLALLFLAACETRIIAPTDQQEPRLNTISVQGTSEFDVTPDIAKISFRVETQSPTAQQAQNKNKDLANSVYNALYREGIREDDIETTTYRIEKIREWENEKYVEKGYRVINVFEVTTKKLESVGPLLDVGVQAGANAVESISFELSDEKNSEAKTEALQRSARNAREKAEALADGIGVRLGKVVSIQEQSYYVRPYAMAEMDVRTMAAEAAPTPISPESVQISVQISVAFEIA
jgi:hypothetical protein